MLVTQLALWRVHLFHLCGLPWHCTRILEVKTVQGLWHLGIEILLACTYCPQANILIRFVNAVSQTSHYRWFYVSLFVISGEAENAKHSKTVPNSLSSFRDFQIGEAGIWVHYPLMGRTPPISSLHKGNQLYKVRPCCHSEHGIELLSLLDFSCGG